VPRGLVFFDLWLAESPRAGFKFPFSNETSPDPVVESLVLIGSSGSVGHTARSDLDYWVCYEPGKLNGEGLALFRQKLALISEWALNEKGTEANFYPVNLEDLRAGKVSRSWGQEIEGEVAPQFLIEELYRTLVFVGGRLPLWMVMPPGETGELYDELAEILAPTAKKGEKPSPHANMGRPQKPKPQEYLAAAMWLTCKSERDPFKGILKIIPILRDIESDFTAPLLCDLVKSEIILNPDPEVPVDPYVMTAERAMEFGKEHLSPAQLSLLRDAAVLKVLGLTGKSRDQNLPPDSDPAKQRVLRRWTEEWEWPPEKLEKILNYDNWSDRERLDQGNELLILLFTIYMSISNRLMALFPDQVNAQDEELTPFACRILGRQKGMEATIELLPSRFHRDSLGPSLTVNRDPAKETWFVLDLDSRDSPDSNRRNDRRDSKDPDDRDDRDAFPLSPAPATGAGERGNRKEKSRIHEAPRLARLAAWLVANQLAGGDREIRFRDDPENPGAPDAFFAAMDAIRENFPPLSFASLDPDRIWLVGAQGTALVFANVETPRETNKLRSVDVVYRTGWGEMRHQFLGLEKHSVEADKYLALSEFLQETCGITDSGILALGHKNPSGFAKRVFMNTKSALNASLARNVSRKSAGNTLIDL
jgi:hypothetical protein